MEEKKKRWRPSLGAYRALENEVSELKEQLRLSERENTHLQDELKVAVCSAKEWENTYNAYKSAIDTEVHELHMAIDIIKSRSLWQRILNR